MQREELIKKAQRERRAARTYAKSRMADMFTLFGEKYGGETITMDDPIKVNPDELKSLEKELNKDVSISRKSKSAEEYAAVVSCEVAVLKYKLDCAEAIFNTYKLSNDVKMRIIEMFDLGVAIRDINIVYLTVVNVLESKKDEKDEKV
jgi:hypothetical protein